MKKFKFRLEKVLQYKSMLKEEKLRELRLQNLKLQEDLARLKYLEEAMLANGTAEGATLSAQELYLSGWYGTRLKDEIVNQKLTVAQSEQAVAEAMGHYIEAAKEEKSLLTLRDRRYREYMEFVEKANAKFLDELSTQKGNTMKVGK